MKAAAYAAADATVNPTSYQPHTDKPCYSRELDVLKRIDRFGLKAILGRDTFYYGELRRLLMAESVYQAYFARQQAAKTDEGWAGWAEKNSYMAQILFELDKESE